MHQAGHHLEMKSLEAEVAGLITASKQMLRQAEMVTHTACAALIQSQGSASGRLDTMRKLLGHGVKSAGGDSVAHCAHADLFIHNGDARLVGSSYIPAA